jgi:hypothetical protein
MAAVDLHLKICEIPDASFIDTKLPATYVAPATHLLGHPGVLPTEAGAAVVGATVPEQGPTTSQACCHAPPYTVAKGSNPT